MAVSEHIAFACKRLIAMPAAEVSGMPIYVEGSCVLSTEDQLVAVRTPGLDTLGIVALAEQALVIGTVDQVHKELVTDAAAEAPRMPKTRLSEACGDDAQLARTQDFLAFHTRCIHSDLFYITHVQGCVISNFYEINIGIH